jgi:adenylate cyclase
MSDIFVSYARSTHGEATRIAQALRELGYGVWLDDDLPAHRPYADVIDERLRAAKAVVVVWSAEAVRSQWVQSEADTARAEHKLVQLTLDRARLPRPFDRIQCADLGGWSGDLAAPGWRKVAASVAELAGAPPAGAAVAAEPPLALPSKPSIAVMPFANLSGDPEQTYFADGMVEEVLAALSRCKSIFVIGSGTTFSFRGKSVTPQEVGALLGVRYVLEGSVRKAGSRVRIAVRLTDAADGAQIWADRFEDTLEDVFALQDRVALGVAGVIEPAVRGIEIRRAVSRPTNDMGSYDLFLRAHALAQTGVMTELARAVDLLEQAIGMDGRFGPALAEAAGCHAVLSLGAAAGERRRHHQRSEELAQQALQFASDDPAVLGAVVGAGAILGRDTAPLRALIDRALSLNPGSARVWLYSGRIHVAMGEADLAVQQIETAMRLDPLSATHAAELGDLGSARLLQRRFDEAILLLRQSVELRRDFAPSYAWLAAALGHAGRLDEARAALARFRSIGVGTIESFAERRFRTLAGRTLFLDGIAQAEPAAGGSHPDQPD